MRCGISPARLWVFLFINCSAESFEIKRADVLRFRHGQSDRLGSGPKAALDQIEGFTAMKIDIDDARDPARFDKVNWTASNGEIDRMVRWVSHIRESIPKEMDLAVDMHGRYDATTGKRGSRWRWNLPAALAGGAGAARKTSTPWRISVIRPKRRYVAAKTIHALGFTELLREARGRYHHAGYSESGRALGSAQSSESRADLLRSVCAALRCLSDRHDGVVPRLRFDPKFPGLRMALDQPAGSLEGLRERRARSSPTDMSTVPDTPGNWSRNE